MSTASAEALSFLAAARVARLATADGAGRPHVVPVCFALGQEARRLYIALDRKPKQVSPERLRRVRNIQVNPRVALVADRYSEDWSELGWAMVEGTASLLEDPAERAVALDLLRGKYPQYREMALDDRPLIAVDVERVRTWGTLA